MYIEWVMGLQINIQIGENFYYTMLCTCTCLCWLEIFWKLWHTTAVSFWNIPFQFIGTVFVMRFQEISDGNELIFWEDPTLKLCRELRWENVYDCKFRICSKLHTSSQINKTALCHCNYVTVSHPRNTLQHHTVSGPQNEYGNIRKQHYFTFYSLSC